MRHAILFFSFRLTADLAFRIACLTALSTVTDLAGDGPIFLRLSSAGDRRESAEGDAMNAFCRLSIGVVIIEPGWSRDTSLYNLASSMRTRERHQGINAFDHDN
jgi:hypothetical protein